ncbi:hypothetical protein [Ferroacidibacillus organovorans]|uniref:Uncharacterized protein n=1 Tax=Ferroacidibacillus organovorans TaxID=1765683 RepID=A0A1V4EQ17_9BACL|nr:hypothetical protein [Ferroacidibacillus organovorans]OPG15033.1 hypothetical protein B2M26_14510 [Ferroacidibacillus organovorans]
MHPLYHQARSLYGQPVCVHAYGRAHYGVIHHVTADGIHLRQMNTNGARTVSIRQNDQDNLPSADAVSAIHHGESESLEQVFWPFFFLPFLAISALSPWWYW